MTRPGWGRRRGAADLTTRPAAVGRGGEAPEKDESPRDRRGGRRRAETEAGEAPGAPGIARASLAAPEGDRAASPPRAPGGGPAGLQTGGKPPPTAGSSLPRATTTRRTHCRLGGPMAPRRIRRRPPRRPPCPRPLGPGRRPPAHQRSGPRPSWEPRGHGRAGAAAPLGSSARGRRIRRSSRRSRRQRRQRTRSCRATGGPPGCRRSGPSRGPGRGGGAGERGGGWWGRAWSVRAAVRGRSGRGVLPLSASPSPSLPFVLSVFHLLSPSPALPAPSSR